MTNEDTAAQPYTQSVKEREQAGRAMLRALHACGIDVTFALAGPSEMFDVASEFFKSEWFNTWLAAHDATLLAHQAERIRELEASVSEQHQYGNRAVHKLNEERFARRAARAEAAAAEAVIEKVRRMPDRHEAVPIDDPVRRHAYLKGYELAIDEARELAATAPTTALEAVKAQVVAETIREFEDLYFGPGVQTRTWVANTMRKRHGLPDRAVEEADK